MSNYECIVCGNQRSIWRCTHCEQADSLNKIASSSSTSSTSPQAGFDGTEWWMATTGGQITSSIVATIFVLYVIWDWSWHGALLVLLFKALMIFCIWMAAFVYWPFALGIFAFLWIAYHIFSFLITTTI
jgi:hypothetical protein